VRGAAVAAFFVAYQAARVAWDLAASVQAIVDLDYVAATCTGGLVAILAVRGFLGEGGGEEHAFCVCI
jgi:hypothetical protein